MSLVTLGYIKNRHFQNPLEFRCRCIEKNTSFYGCREWPTSTEGLFGFKELNDLKSWKRSRKTRSPKAKTILGLSGGGTFKYFLEFSPRKLGKIFTHFDEHIFQMG